MLGFENSHWLFDSSNQEPVVPKQQSEKMQQANAELLNHDGISVFPYLSSFGAIYPYVTEQMIPCRDLSAQDRTVWLSPFSPEGQHFAEIDAALEQYYTVLSQ